MATVKIFDANGVKELQCFDTLSEIPYLEEEDLAEESVQDDDSIDF